MRKEATTLGRAGSLIVGLGIAVAMAMLMEPRAAAQNGEWTLQPAPQASATAGKAGKPAEKKAKERTISISLAKGQTYTINGVAKNAAPSTKVVDNPNALVVQTAPGRIVLVGSATGTWKLHVTLADGEKVIYEVNVSAAGTEQGSLVPGAAPTVMH